jgi:hypothetical protein
VGSRSDTSRIIRQFEEHHLPFFPPHDGKRVIKMDPDAQMKGQVLICPLTNALYGADGLKIKISN